MARVPARDTRRLLPGTRRRLRIYVFLVSGDALARLEVRDGYTVEDLGPQAVRGRAAPVHVFAVEMG